MRRIKRYYVSLLLHYDWNSKKCSGWCDARRPLGSIYISREVTWHSTENICAKSIFDFGISIEAKNTRINHTAVHWRWWLAVIWSDVMMTVITDLRLRSSRQLDDGDLRCVLASIAASIWSWTGRGQGPPLTNFGVFIIDGRYINLLLSYVEINFNQIISKLESHDICHFRMAPINTASTTDTAESRHRGQISGKYVLYGFLEILDSSVSVCPSQSKGL